jgi:enoyl-CoA hydratase/carnithine racemase
MTDLRRDGNVFVVTMQAGENRFNRSFVDALTGALDTVETSAGAAALVTTGGQEKFYSTGLDFDWLGGEGCYRSIPAWSPIVKSRLAAGVFRDVVLTGARIGGGDARERGIVDDAVAAVDVLPRAIARAAALAQKDRQTYATLKRGIYADLLDTLKRAVR